MAISPQSSESFALTKTISSIKSRTDQITKINSETERLSLQKDMFWEKQKKDIYKVIDSLKYDTSSIRTMIKNNVITTESLITEFRRKIKKEQMAVMQNRVDKWRLEEFVTRKRFNEILAKEIELSD